MSYLSNGLLSRGFQVGASWAEALEQIQSRVSKVTEVSETVELFISMVRLKHWSVKSYNGWVVSSDGSHILGLSSSRSNDACVAVL